MSNGQSFTPGVDAEPKSLGGSQRVVAGEDNIQASNPDSFQRVTVTDGPSAEDKAALDAQGKAALNAAPDQEAEKAAEDDKTAADAAAAAEAEKAKEGEGDGDADADADVARFAPYTQEYEESGELSAESVTKAAAEFGVSEDVVRTYVAGLGSGNDAEAVQLQTDTNRLHEAFGGPKAYDAFIEWAEDGGVSSTEQTIYNALLDSNVDGALAYAEGLKEKFEASGNAPRREITRAPGAAAMPTEGFKSVAAMKAAMSDSRYAKDPAYRAEVEAKVGAM